jgi:hypothetical protein
MVERYNPDGEWRPFAQGSDEAAARARALELTHDLDLLGPLFYVFYTGLPVFEFVLRGSFALPLERMSFSGGRVNLYRCPPFHPIQNTVVYDGWAPLQSINAAELRSLFRLVGQVTNRLAFAYRASVDWRPKYLDFTAAEGFATPDEDDLQRLDTFLTPTGTENEIALLDAAIDWYNRSRGSRNPLNAFLGYYVSMEAVAIAIGEGTVDFGLGIQRESPSDRRSRTTDCIHSLFTELYESKPIHFVDRAYFHCVKSLRHRVEIAAIAVLGAERASEIFRTGDQGHSLSGIRSQIAHGNLALSSPHDEALVRENLGRMAGISREFLLRLLLRVPSNQPLPTWSGRHRVGIPFPDPRGAWIVPPEFIAAHNWRLRPEWCE